MIQTSEFVRKQIEAMKSDVFELGLFRLPSAVDGRDAEMLPRAWDAEALLRSVAWLRLENMRGRNIYIRPQGEHHLSLVDDLSKSAIDRMKAEGFQPAAIVETSPQNFQVWLNHGERLPRELGTAVARALASRFEGDTKAADWRHFGRLSTAVDANLVEFCPPEPLSRLSVVRQYRNPGNCPDGENPLLKPVVAKSGDVVVYSGSGVRVNGILLRNTAPRPQDSKGRPLPHYPFGTYRVAPGTLWVASSYHALSFDSRYFGPISTAIIRDWLKPLFTL